MAQVKKFFMFLNFPCLEEFQPQSSYTIVLIKKSQLGLIYFMFKELPVRGVVL